MIKDGQQTPSRMCTLASLAPPLPRRLAPGPHLAVEICYARDCGRRTWRQPWLLAASGWVSRVLALASGNECLPLPLTHTTLLHW